MASIFFPFVSLYKTGTDMQPYSLVLAMFGFIIVEHSVRLQKTFFFLGIVLFFAVTIMIVEGITFGSVRSVLNYAQILFVSYFCFIILNKGIVNLPRFMVVTLFIWLLVGVIQALYDKNFLLQILSASRTSDDRGVTSLASEPTMFGLILIFYILFFLHLRPKYMGLLILLCGFGIVLLAKASMPFLLLSIIAVFYMIFKGGVRSFLFVPAGIVSFFLAASLLFEGTRISLLSNMFFTDPKLLIEDLSVNDRLFHLIGSISGFLENYGIPNGFLYWPEYSLSATNSSVFFDAENISTARIMSGFGGTLFELGIIGIFFIATVVRTIYLCYPLDFRNFLFFTLSITLLMLTAIPVGFSFFALFIGLLLHGRNVSLRLHMVVSEQRRSFRYRQIHGYH
jgi:hypothetical protein